MTSSHRSINASFKRRLSVGQRRRIERGRDYDSVHILSAVTRGCDIGAISSRVVARILRYARTGAADCRLACAGPYLRKRVSRERGVLVPVLRHR